MIKVNFKDGTTLAFDLTKEDDVKQWLEWSLIRDFQERITGVGILHNKKYYSIPLPKNFHHCRFSAELVHKMKGELKRQVGIKLCCIADDILMSLFVYTYNDPPPPIASRIDMERLKKRRWNVQEVFGK